MSVPQLSVYMPENKAFKIQIDSATPSNGHINGTYESQFSPEGGFSATGHIGTYSWVTSDAAQGKSGVAPFCIRFSGVTRSSNFDYCIYDTWNGVYLDNDTMLLTGTRGYVNSRGVIESICLGTHVFSK
jgi:hypothetical protein